MKKERIFGEVISDERLLANPVHEVCKFLPGSLGISWLISGSAGRVGNSLLQV